MGSNTQYGAWILGSLAGAQVISDEILPESKKTATSTLRCVSTNDRMIDAKSLTVKPGPVGHKTEGHYIVNASGGEAARQRERDGEKVAIRIFNQWDLSISGSSLAILESESTAISLTMRNQRASIVTGD